MDDRLIMKYLLVMPILFSSYYLHAQVQCNYFSAGLTVSNAPLIISYSDNSEETAFELSKFGFVIEVEGDRELDNNRRFSTSGGIKLFTGGARHSERNNSNDSLSKLLFSTVYNTLEVSSTFNINYTLVTNDLLSVRFSAGIGMNAILNTAEYDKEPFQTKEKSLIKTAYNFDGHFPLNLEFNTGLMFYKQIKNRRYFVKYAYAGKAFPII